MADETLVPEELTEASHAYIRAVGARLRGIGRHHVAVRVLIPLARFADVGLLTEVYIQHGSQGSGLAGMN